MISFALGFASEADWPTLDGNASSISDITAGTPNEVTFDALNIGVSTVLFFGFGRSVRCTSLEANLVPH
jgi:hypothetical protein